MNGVLQALSVVKKKLKGTLSGGALRIEGCSNISGLAHDACA